MRRIFAAEITMQAHLDVHRGAFRFFGVVVAARGGRRRGVVIEAVRAC